MNGLIVVPLIIVEKIDAIVSKFRTDHPDATDTDAAAIRQQLVNAFGEYGTLPEFEIVKSSEAVS
jgi:hypothetical protein